MIIGNLPEKFVQKNKYVIVLNLIPDTYRIFYKIH